MGLSLEETNARRMLFEQQTSFGILKGDVKIGRTCQWRRNGGHVQYSELYYRNDENQENNFSIYIQNVATHARARTHIFLTSKRVPSPRPPHLLCHYVQSK